MNKPVTWEKQDLLLCVYVQPGAKQDKVVGLYQAHIKIQITAPAIENKANHFLGKWLAKQLKVSKAQVILEKGHKSRYKTFRIHSPQQIPIWLSELLPKDP
jgi:uncharacterized protein